MNTIANFTALRDELKKRRNATDKQLVGIVVDFVTPTKVSSEVKSLIRYCADKGLLSYCLQLSTYKAYDVNQKAHSIFSKDQLTIDTDLVNFAADLCSYLAGHEQLSTSGLKDLIAQIDAKMNPDEANNTPITKKTTTTNTNTTQPKTNQQSNTKRTQSQTSRTTPPPLPPVSQPQTNRYQQPLPSTPKKEDFFQYIGMRLLVVGALGFMAGGLNGCVSGASNPFAAMFNTGFKTFLLFGAIALLAGYGAWWIQYKHPKYQPAPHEKQFSVMEYIPWIIGAGIVGTFSGGLLGFFAVVGLVILIKFITLFSQLKN